MGSPRASALGFAMIAVAGVCFGSIGVFNHQLLAAGLTVPQMLATRFGVGAAALWAVAFARGEVRAIPLRRSLTYVALGGLYVAEAWMYFESSLRIPIALTAMLLYLYPVLVAAAAWALFDERLGIGGLVALGVAMGGVVLVVGAPSGSLDAGGVALGAGTAVAYGAYVLLSSRLGPGTSAMVSSAWIMSTAALVFTLIACVGPRFAVPDLAAIWPALVGLTVVTTIIPIPLVLLGVARIGASKASIISTIEPISAALCGAFFLGERLSPLQWLGGACVVGAVATLALQNLKGARDDTRQNV